VDGQWLSPRIISPRKIKTNHAGPVSPGQFEKVRAVHSHYRWTHHLDSNPHCCRQFAGGVGFSLFQVPFNLAAGGISGLGIILNHFTNTPICLTILVLNIPLLIIGLFQLGRWRFLVSTVLATLCFSGGGDIFNSYLPQSMENWPITDDLLLASIYAGVLFGFGMGIIQRSGGTIGGTSIPARILYERKGFPMSQSYLFTDIAIIVVAGLLFRWKLHFWQS
jgi:uncharacterized membrane-anchored protein YitT (DUF2179 family)